MDSSLKKQLAVDAAKIRLAIIEGTFHAKSGHPGGSLSITETLAYLYRCVLNVDPKNPHWADRDRLVLSKGHTAPALYGALALHGFFPESEIARLRKPDSFLQGHPDMQKTPGVDMSTGSLGQGMSTAIGLAMASKIKKQDNYTYLVLGDGECNEGSVWEAAMALSHYKLNNVITIVDRNKCQIDGTTEQVMALEPFADKWRAFGLDVVEIDGNDMAQVCEALDYAWSRSGEDKPVLILANTVKGKGADFMETQVPYHYCSGDTEVCEKAKASIMKMEV